MDGLDARDRKLICLLDQDARRPLSSLAKELRISKQAVRQRIFNLRKEGIISSTYAIINTLAMGRFWARLWIRLQMASPQIEGEMAEFARKQEDVGWVIKMTGRYDLALVYWPKSMQEFKGLSDEFIFRFSNYIKDHEVSFITVGHDFSHRVLSPEIESVETVVKLQGIADLDETDRKILNLLAVHADWSALRIGKAAGLEPKTVYYRIKKMEKGGVVLNYRLRLDYEKLGYTWYKFFLTFSNPDGKKISRLFSFLRGMPELIYITEVLGSADLEFELLAPSAKRMQGIISSMRSNFPSLIKDYNYLEVREACTLRYFPE